MIPVVSCYVQPSMIQMGGFNALHISNGMNLNGAILNLLGTEVKCFAPVLMQNFHRALPL